jgi:exo-1,4-beta-D-glucosaminidase
LLLKRGGAVLDRNVYWMSTQPDVVDWPATEGSPQATMTSYASLAALNSLPTADVKVKAVTVHQHGPDGADLATRVTITNTSKRHTVALFVRADVLRGTANGHVLPGDSELETSTWNDNDVTLWPGESQTLTVSYDSSELAGATPVISLFGWNAAVRHIAAPVT